jgi:hypothetical protein
MGEAGLASDQEEPTPRVAGGGRLKRARIEGEPLQENLEDGLEEEEDAQVCVCVLCVSVFVLLCKCVFVGSEYQV